MRRALVFAALLVVSCRPTEDTRKRLVELPTDEPPLPEGPGKQAFEDSCRMCHSTRYVTDQPRLSRATWTAEVEKMRGVYGAPIPTERVASIVDYLASVNGTGK